MPISFNCPQCGKSYATSDDTAGKRARCKQCGNTMTIPRPKSAGGAPPIEDIYGVASAPPPRRSYPDEDEVLPRRPAFKPQSKSSSGNSGVGKKAIGGGSVLVFLLIIALKVGLRVALHQGKGDAQQQAAVAVDTKGPIALPAFPDPGPGREIEPGVKFHEIRLPGGNQPGFGGKLWLYLPSDAQGLQSLPCVMITGAGSTLLEGMDLGDGDRPEHLPYVHAGYAVMAFELDGALPDVRSASSSQRSAASRKFLAARAGLVNAHIALEYVLAKVPQVDPQRIFAAGHSSAGTLALLFAEHEPRLKGCVAYAPCIDIGERFGATGVALRLAGLGDLFTKYSPKMNGASLSCPLFLFHALDDSNVPASSSIQWADELKAQGKNVTLETVPTGNHYDSMIQQGIPHAIAWLQAESGAAPIAQSAPTGPVAPAPASQPPPVANGFPTGPRPPASGANGFPYPPPGNGFPPPPANSGPMPPRGPRMPPGFPPPRRPRMRPNGGNPF